MMAATGCELGPAVVLCPELTVDDAGATLPTGFFVLDSWVRCTASTVAWVMGL